MRSGVAADTAAPNRNRRTRLGSRTTSRAAQLKLKSFQIGPYRNVIDSGVVDVHPEATVLVGKNESGKTNLLHALHTLNPANGVRAMSRLDYPRWLMKAHDRSGEYERAEPVKATFLLTDADKEEVAGRFGDGVLLGDTFTVWLKYGTDERPEPEYGEVECDGRKAVEHILADLSIAVSVDEPADIGPLREYLETPAEDEDENGDEEEDGEETENETETALERLSNIYGGHDCVSCAVAEYLSEKIPAFFYFDDHAQLPGTIDIGPLVEALRSGEDAGLSDGQLTTLAFLRMGYADDEVVDDDYEVRKAELQAVGADLTRDVLSYWRQNPHLRLQIDIDKVEGSHPDGPRIVRRDLKIDVHDDRHYFTNSLDARSSGFRWFVSFIAAFNEFEEDSNVIVLLDEPGLGLHARAQDDFLRFIDERIATKHQVFFTTHSPFMVDPKKLERVRVVEDAGPEEGVKVSKPKGTHRDPDTLFPLQAALGYDIAQNLFVGSDNLVVEGLSDFNYLRVMSNHLESLDRTGLNERWRILPAGGAGNLSAFVTLVGPTLDVSVLVDGNQADSQRIQNMIEEGLLDGKRLITPEPGSDVKHPDIEDLFTDAEYLNLYNSATGGNLKASSLTGNDGIVKRIERAVDGPFNHNVPAHYLIENSATVLPDLSAETLDRFENLIEAINATLAS